MTPDAVALSIVISIAWKPHSSSTCPRRTSGKTSPVQDVQDIQVISHQVVIIDDHHHFYPFLLWKSVIQILNPPEPTDLLRRPNSAKQHDLLWFRHLPGAKLWPLPRLFQRCFTMFHPENHQIWWKLNKFMRKTAAQDLPTKVAASCIEVRRFPRWSDLSRTKSEGNSHVKWQHSNALPLWNALNQLLESDLSQTYYWLNLTNHWLNLTNYWLSPKKPQNSCCFEIFEVPSSCSKLQSRWNPAAVPVVARQDSAMIQQISAVLGLRSSSPHQKAVETAGGL
jgi:hypothetical protein